MWLKDEIIHCTFKKKSIVTLKEAQAMVSSRLEFQKGKSHKAIQFISDYQVVTKEAKQFLAKEGFKGIEKVALIIDTKLKVILGNMWIQINKPIGPTRLFTDTDEAMKWLNENSKVRNA